MIRLRGIRVTYKNRIRRPIATWLVTTAMACAQRLPPSRIKPVGRCLGTIAWLLAGSSRSTAERQIVEILPSTSSRDGRIIVRRLFQNLGMNALETFRLPSMTSEQRLALADLEGLDLFDDVFKKGRGLLAITGHIGSWELLAAYFSDLGYPVNVVARRRSNPGLGRIVSNIRSSYGVRELDRERDAKQMIRALRRGEVVAILVDQDTRVDGMFVPFLGRDAYTPSGHARLALRIGSPMVVLTIVRQRTGRHLIRVIQEIPIPDEDRENDARWILERCNDLLSAVIREYPDQWIWFHRRWRRSANRERER